MKIENRKIAIIGNPSVGTITALQSRFPECSIVVVNDTQSKIDTSKYEARFSSYLFDRFEAFYTNRNSIASILKANGVTSYESLVREYKLIQEKKGKLPYRCRLAVCQVYEEIHKN